MMMDRPLSALSLGRKLVDIIQNGECRQAEKLLQQGADPNAVQQEGVTPFHFAVGQEGEKSLELTKLFLAYGGDPNIRCGEGMTPLHTAATWGNVGCLSLLLANGGDPQLHDQDGLDCLDLASQYENSDCVQLLLSHLTYMYTETPADTSCKYTLVPCDDLESLSFLKDEHVSLSPRKSVFKPKQRRTTLYTEDINQMLSRYLQEGERVPVIFDVTSPAHPYIEAKSESVLGRRYDCSVSDNGRLDITGSSEESFVTCASEDSQQNNVSPENAAGVKNHEKCSPVVRSSSPIHEAPIKCLFQKTGARPIPSRSKHNASTFDHCNYSHGGFHDDSGFEAAVSWGEISSLMTGYWCCENVRDNVNQFRCSGLSQFCDQPPVCSCFHRIPCLSQHVISDAHHDHISHSPTCTMYSSCAHNSRPCSPRVPPSHCYIRGPNLRSCTHDARRTQDCYSPNRQDGLSRSHAGLSPLQHHSLHGACTSKSPTFHVPGGQSRSQTGLVENLEGLHLKDNRFGDPSCQRSPKRSCGSKKTENMSEQNGDKCSGQMVNRDNLDDSVFSHISIEPSIGDETPTPTLSKLKEASKMGESRDDGSMAEFLPEDFNLSDLTLNTKSNSPDSELNTHIYMYPHDRTSLDSANSLTSTIDYVYTDPEEGITLIERRCPSIVSASSVRTSLDSMTSGLTGDLDNSESTILYNWQDYAGSGTHTKFGGRNPPASQSSSNGSHSGQTPVGSTCKSEESNKTLTNTPKSNITPTPTPAHGSEVSTSSPAPKKLDIPPLIKKLSNQELRSRLTILGDEPGPITKATRQTYLSRLVDLENNPDISRLILSRDMPGYSAELRHALADKFGYGGLEDMEVKMVDAFQKPRPDRKWREGTLKSSFNYLLLDPRVAQNLPLRTAVLGEAESFKVFISAIFYVGKGKRSRPYCHLYEAITHRKAPQDKKPSEKVQRILDIWGADLGVISLHIFQNVIPVEAYTREACMVDAFGLGKLTNKKKGDYYGIASTWSAKQRRSVGVLLLKKAMKIFLSEGERQICPPDIGIGQ